LVACAQRKTGDLPGMTMGDRERQHVSERAGNQRTAAAIAGLLFSLFTAGCGNTLYAIQANAAASKLEEARELQAEKYAPYEYYYAKEHLDKAMEEAADADYSDATNLAEGSEVFAEKAIRLARDAHRGAGR
jgi:hypothetical protein